MPKIKQNFGGVSKGGGITLIDSGDYLLKVFDFDIKEGTKDDYVEYQLQVQGGKFDGKVIKRNLSLSEKAKGFVLEFLTALGFEVPNEEGAKDFEWDPDKTLGKELRAEVYKYQDEASKRWYLDVFNFREP